MMVARKLAIDELHIAEQPLPLDNLDRNFLVADALLTPEGQPANWPKADVIIGNPPFIGAKMLKPERGPDYVNAVRRAYPDVPGMAGYCVYWFRKPHVLDARRYEAPFRHIEQTVLPHVLSLGEVEQNESGKKTGQDQQWLKTWWQHFRCRKELIDSLSKLPRYLACCEVTKRPIFCFLDPDIRPDHTLEAFVLPDDYSFGVLQSSVHWLWFITKCSKLTERFRYTPESVFDTFPWPQSPEAKQVEVVAEAGRQVRRVRTGALGGMIGDLRALYRTLELPGANPLKDAHAALDTAVLAAYGFSAKKDLLAQLLELNLDVAQGIENGGPVTAPGIPASFPGPEALISDDCIRPQALVY